MNEKLNYKLYIGLGLGFAVILGAFIGLTIKQQNVLASSVNTATDLIGSRVGTTTTAVGFYAPAASTTYRAFIGGETDSATLNLKAVAASSTGAIVALHILGSNDTECNTASTSAATLNTVLTKDINWFDISSNIKELAGSTSLAATTTVIWNPTNGGGKSIVLKDLSVQCIRVDVNASSTELYGQLRIKQSR